MDTIKEEVMKKARDYSFITQIQSSKRRVKAIKLTDNTFTVYDCINSCQKDLQVNAGVISYCCEGKNNVKSGCSKLDHQRYKFEYTDDEVTKIIPRKNARVIKPRKVKVLSDKTPAQRYLDNPENRARHLTYMKTKVECPACKVMLARANMPKHKKTKNHILQVANKVEGA